jgi:predicted transcriptional regulator
VAKTPVASRSPADTTTRVPPPVEDVIRHPASSISETSERTGFAQSHVSVSVARLKARGLAETETDPADGRHTAA